jgi:hypothetical protein
MFTSPRAERTIPSLEEFLANGDGIGIKEDQRIVETQARGEIIAKRGIL